MKIRRLKDEATKDTAVGYCFLRKHEGNINKKQLKRHRCIEKECPYFIRYQKTESTNERYNMIDKNKLKRTIQERFFELTKGETDDQIMTKTGLTENDIERIEDAATVLNPEKLKAIADAYDVSIDWIVGRTDKKTI